MKFEWKVHHNFRFDKNLEKFEAMASVQIVCGILVFKFYATSVFRGANFLLEYANWPSELHSFTRPSPAPSIIRVWQGNGPMREGGAWRCGPTREGWGSIGKLTED